jgi:glycosyltransferase involved in cell wall biosynthesis
LLVDPGDRVALRGAMVRLLNDSALRRQLREQGPVRARSYTWERSAAMMTELFAEAVR